MEENKDIETLNTNEAVAPANNETVKTVSYSTTTINIPEDYKPIGPWGYIGYELLFSLPLIGLIFMLVFAFGDGNVNRKNFAKSNLIIILFTVIVSAVIFLIFMALGIGFNSVRYY